MRISDWSSDVCSSDLTTVDLVRACAPRWSNEEIARFERTVLSYRPPVPEHLEEPKQRKFFADMVRSTKKDLLQAVGVERLADENRELVATEQRARGGQFDRQMEIGRANVRTPVTNANA